MIDYSQDANALFATVGDQGKINFQVSFGDIQQLETIQKKLVKAKLILNSNAEVWKSFRVKMTTYLELTDNGTESSCERNTSRLIRYNERKWKETSAKRMRQTE